MPAKRAAALAALALARAAGCGDDERSDSAPVEETDLTLTLDADGPGGEEPQTAELSCPGANAPRTACEAIEGLPDDALDPVPADTPCTQIYGGPDVLRIEGTLKGEEVDSELTRANGCEIERYDHFAPLLEALFPDYEPGESIQP